MRLSLLVAAIATVGVAASLFSSSAFAQGTSAESRTGNWYFSGSTSLLHSRDRSKDVGLGTAADFKDGWAFTGAVGYRKDFKSVSVRLEAEVTEQNNRNKQFVAVGQNAFGVAVGDKQESFGNVGLSSYMFNIAIDGHIPSMPKVTPFISYGMGTYQSSINGFTTVNGALNNNGIVISSKSLYANAYQWRIGVGYKVDQQTDLFLGYRRFEGSDLNFRFLLPPSTIIPLKVTGGKTDSLELGVRVKI